MNLILSSCGTTARMQEERFHGRNRYDYMDIGGRAMQELLPRVESGTETENNALGHAYMEVGGTSPGWAKVESSQEQRPRATHTAMDGR